MFKTESGESSVKFSDALKTPWIKYSIILGIIIIAIGLVTLLLFRIFDISSTQFFLDMEAFIKQYGLLGIFLATILAGTVVPLGSPALVAAAGLFGVPLLPLILVSTTGFTIGMMINYGLAYRLGRPYVEKKVSVEKLEETLRLWNRWGWILYTIFGLIPVLPVELLSFVCGLLKTRLHIFLILTFVPRLIVFAILAIFGEQAGIWMGAI